MINFVTGKPGAGKSLWAVRMIVDELRHTRRMICTNLALKLPDLAQYLHDNYGDTFGMNDRIRILSAVEVCEFWLYTKHWSGFGLPRVKLAETSRGKVIERPDLSGRYGDGGVLYLLDELHEYFGARNWQSTGEDALFYLSQHRKLSDDVVCITQAFANVDKQFRSVAQDFTVLRNIGVEQLGWFRLPKKILRSTFLSPPTGAEQPAVKSVMSIDVQGLCKCYDTAAGVGVVGKYADTGKKLRGGLPWQIFVLFVIGALALLFFLPKIAKAFGAQVAPSLTPHGVVTTNEVVAPSYAENSQAVHSQPNAAPSYAEKSEAENQDEKPEVVGWGQNGKKVTWWLSDGSTVNGTDVSMVTDKGIVVFGELLRFEKRKRYNPAPSYAGKVDGETVLPVRAPSYAPNVNGALANPGATGSRRIRIMGFDGKTHAVRTIEKKANETVNQLEESDGDALGG